MGYSSLVVLACFAFGIVSALPAEPKPCATEACKKAAEYITDAMNATANPCDNFYEYACGGWQHHHEIPEWKSRTGTFDALNDKMEKNIRDILEKFNVTSDSKTSASSVAYGAYVYQQCLALGKQTNESGLVLLKETVKTILVDHGWDIGTVTAKADYSWNDNFVKAYLAGVSAVFAPSVQPDPKNVTVNIITLDPASFGLGDKELQNLTDNAKVVSAYKDYIRKSAKLFCGDKCQASLENDIDDIVNLESELAKNKLSVEDQRDPETLYNVFTFKQLKEKTKFDWLNSIVIPIVKSFGISNDLSESSTILVSDVNYTVKALEILAKTNARTLSNYIGWRIVSNFGPHSSEQFRQIVFEFNKVSTGVKRLEERNENCYNLAYGRVNMALSRLFVDHFFSEKEKQEATDLITSIQQSFHALIEQNQWLDPETKKASLSKLNHVTKNVAYPAWVRKDSELDEFYFLQNKTDAQDLLANKNFLVSLVKFSALQVKKSIVEFSLPINIDKNWPMPPAIINAAYEPEQNSITIPAGILKSPFFDGERPFSLNYGFIGVVIGHEFTHGLDDQGRQYDEQGNLHNWWTQEAIKRFHNRSECFVQQYGSQVEPITGLHLNGKNTLGENIADNGGLHESYNAFQSRQAKSGPSPTLADLPKLTSEQLYFISYANTWCSLIRPEKLKLQIEYDPHSPARYRVNMPLSNSADFAKAFKCPVGSAMNPGNKCLLW